MKVVFFGSSQYSLPVLETLNKNFELVLVITRPDKPIGRKQILTPSATKVWAEKNGIPVKTNLSDLSNSSDLSFALVADFGRIIPEEVFNQPRFGTFNIHFSKLPDLRGPSPVQATLLRGDTTAWITIFKLDKEIDTGPILWQKEYPILPDDTTGSLYTRLFIEVARELPEILKNYELRIKNQEKNTIIPQDHNKATYTQKLTKQDGFVEWSIIHNSKFIIQTYNRFRAMTPWPGLWTLTPDGKRMKILKCRLEGSKLVLDEIQFEGKKARKFNG